MLPIRDRSYGGRPMISGAAVLLLAVAVSQLGCATGSGSGPSEPGRLPEHFACTEWLDDNGDDLVQPGEYKGIRDTFFLPDQITFVAHYEGLGSNILWRLYRPDGTIYRSGTSFGRYNRAWRSVRFQVRHLIGRELDGNWRMEWYLEGEPTKITRVRLLR